MRKPSDVNYAMRRLRTVKCTNEATKLQTEGQNTMHN